MATSTLGSGTLVLAGTTSGTTTVTATAVAGTTTLTLPAATDTLVGKATTDTLTNKTLTSPTITGGALNGTLGATTPSTGAFTTLDATGDISTTSTGRLNLRGSATSVNNDLQIDNSDTLVNFRGSRSNAVTKGYVWYLNNSTTEGMRIDSSGNLLVGTTSGTQSRIVKSISGDFVLRVENSLATNPYVLELMVPTASANDTSHAYFICRNANGTNRAIIFGNGNVVNVNNSYGAISDVKLKQNIVDASPKLADLMQVQVRNYNLIGETTKQIGVVAQELETVFPAMVDESPDKDAEGNDLGTTTKSVKYSVFVPMLIKAMQEQQALITQLTARITALESA